MSAANAIKARITPPNLSDTRLYVCLPGVAILDVHCRNAVDQNGNSIETYCGPEQLVVLAKNSQARADRGDYGLIRVGHIDVKLPNHRERDQPQIIGYIPRFYMGEKDDSTVILADIYIKKQFIEDVENYPRRSPEIFGKTDPDGFIDALALLNRPPERDLGLVTYAKETNPPGERTMIDDNDCMKLAQMFKSVLQEVLEGGAGGGEEPKPEPEPMMDSMPSEDMAAGDMAGAGPPVGTPSGDSFPGATSSFIPGLGKEKEMEPKGKDPEHMQSSVPMQEFVRLRGEFEQFSRQVSEGFNAAGKRIKDLEKDLGEKNITNRRLTRTSRLQKLQREGSILNVEKELELCMNMNDVEFETNVNRIRECYARDITNRPFILVDDVVGTDETKAAPKNRFTQREIDGRALELYSKEPDNKNLKVGELNAKFFGDTEYRKRFLA